MNLRQLIYMKAVSEGSTPLVEATASGNPATFTTDVKKALAGLTIPFTPMQTGSGDPTPDNVREILGKSEIRILHSGEDTSDPSIVTASLGGNIYGGTFDAVTGVLSVEWTVMSSKWGNMINAYSSETVVERMMLTDDPIIPAGSTGANLHLCNVAKYIWAGTANETPHFYTGRSGSYNKNAAYVHLPAGTSDDLTVIVVAKLSETYTVQLDPVTINTVIGENNIWTDTNSSNTVTYLKKE